MKMLEAEDLCVSRGGRDIVRHVSFSVSEGDWLMIVGPNGAGKTTVVNAISQGVPYTGRITFRERELRSYKPSRLARRIGVLSQNHTVGYAFSVEEVVKLGRYAYAPGLFPDWTDADRRAVDEALDRTGLRGVRSQSVLTLSGGELQRVFLAQIFAQDPELLILDEPTNHLDLVYQKQVFSLIEEWRAQPGRAVVSVVHDLSLALAFGSGVMLMSRGAAAACGPAREVLTEERLREVYEMDVKGWMRTLLSRWESV